MSLASAPSASPVDPPLPLRTLADVVAELGDVPLERILMRPPAGTATEADLIAVNEQKQVICELIDRTLVAKTMGTGESEFAALLMSHLIPFVRAKNLGVVVGGDGEIRLNPELILVPDVSFISWNRLPDRRRPQTAIWSVAPDLVVEVWSRSNRAGEMRRKREVYFAAGVRVVWEFHLERRAAMVFHEADAGEELDSTRTLDGGAILPGFTLPLTDLFSALNETGDSPTAG